MAALHRQMAAAMLMAASVVYSSSTTTVHGSSPIAPSIVPNSIHIHRGSPRNLADRAGFQLHHGAPKQRLRRSRGARQPLFSPPPSAAKIKSARTTALSVETKEREETIDVVVNGDVPKKVERLGDVATATNGATGSGGGGDDLVDFFDRIFQKESFGALVSDDRHDGVGLANGDIRSSIESLTAEA